MLFSKLRKWWSSKTPDLLIVEVDEKAAANEPIDHGRVAAIMQAIRDEGMSAPSDLLCRCNAEVPTGSAHWYRYEFFCSEQCLRAAVEQQQRLSAYFFHSFNEGSAKLAGDHD